MQRARRGILSLLLLPLLAVAFWGGLATAQHRRGAGAIVGVYGVGGIISEDGALWQYNPEQKRWMTIDDAFKLDQHETHILPLPVPAQKIRFMQSWGFLVTQDGEVWQYDLDENRWRNIGTP